MGELFYILLVFVVDFLLASVGFLIVSLALSAFGVMISFSWGGAFAFWVIILVIRALLRTSSN